MKKFFAILGVIFLVLIGGCMAMGYSAVSSVEQAMEEYEKETQNYNEIAQQMVDETTWTIEESTFGKMIIGNLTNTQEYKVDYLEINYKLMDENGVTVSSSFTNETDIEPGETVRIEINTFEDFVDYKLTGTMSVYGN